MAKLKEKRRLGQFFHDCCMRGARPVKVLGEVWGEGKFNTAPPLPCKRSTGTRVIEVAATAKRRAHKRTLQNWEPKKRCHCTLPSGASPAKSPDVNIAENMFNMIQQELSGTPGADSLKVGQKTLTSWKHELLKQLKTFQSLGTESLLRAFRNVGRSA